MTTRGTIEEKMSFLFDMYDTDKKGYLTQEQILQVIEAMLELLEVENKKPNSANMTEECVRLLDKAKDGIVSKGNYLK